MSPTAVQSLGRRAFRAIRGPGQRVRVWPFFNLPATTVIRAFTPSDSRQRAIAARHLPRVGIVTTSLPGGEPLRLWSRGDDNAANRIFWHGWAATEPETLPCFLQLARTSRITLDIGAHVGVFSLLAALVNREGRVFAFEPLPQVYERLVRNAALNGVRNLACLRLAVGRYSGWADLFHQDSGIPSSSSIDRSFMVRAVPPERLVTSRVPVVNLDQFVGDRGLSGVDLVKLDVEATEHHALAGMAGTLERERPKLICEVLPQGQPQDIEDLLRPLSYRYFLLTDKGPEARTRLRADARWRNYLMVPGEVP